MCVGYKDVVSHTHTHTHFTQYEKGENRDCICTKVLRLVGNFFSLKAMNFIMFVICASLEL